MVTATTAVDTHGIAPEVYERRWVILGTLCLSLVIIVIAVSSMNIALPSIQNALGSSASQLQWIVDAYALAFAGLLLSAGSLGDRFGRKGALQTGLVIFGVAALVASTSRSAAMLIALRTVMGLGAALIMPATLSIVINSFPFQERPKAIAVWSGFAGVGGALGPIVAGLLLDHFWWGSVLLVNVPVVVLLLVLSAFILPKSKDPDGHALDPLGAFLSIVGLIALVYAVIEGPDQGWVAGPTIAGFIVAVFALSAFVKWELRATYPMLDPRLFRRRGFATGSGTVTLAFFNMFATFFLLTQYLQFVKLYSPLQAGLRVIPNGAALLFMAPRGPTLVQRFGVRRVVTAGYLVTAGGFVIISFATSATPYPLLAVALVCTGSGIAVIVPSASQHIVASLPLAKAGVGSAVNDVTREVGGALGIAVAGSVATSIYRNHVGFTAQIADSTARHLARRSVGQAVEVAHRALAAGQVTKQQAALIVHSAGHAFTSGTRVAFLMLAGCSAFGAATLGRSIPDSLPTRQQTRVSE